MHQSVLAVDRYRYLKLAAVLVTGACALYALHEPMGEPNGGTWVGYLLGTAAALLIVWLTWFGVRRRQYGAAGPRLQVWLSAHVYLGLAVPILATLHCGFQFGWNVHTLAWALTLLVVLSGAWGLGLYLVVPRRRAANRHGATLDAMLAEIAELSQRARGACDLLDDEIAQAVLRACAEVRLGGTVIQQLRGHDPGCPTARALRRVEARLPELPPAQAAQGRLLVGLLARKLVLLERARTDIRYQALLQTWLYAHVPLSVTLLGALAAHVFAVFFFR